VEKFTGTGGAVQWNQYLYAGGEMVGVRYDYNNAPTAIRYFDKDNLGSIATITDEGGTVVERDSFDAWGKRRFPNGNDDPSDSITSLTTRGYTGQEELADVGLVHLNGRVYDPLIGRFTSADPVAAQPYETQGFDRYAYVGNNPLAFTDPNGFCGFFCVLGHIFNPVQVFNDQISVLKAIYSVPYLGQALNIATAAVVTYYTGGCVQCGIAVSSALSSLQAGVTSGKLGEALKAGAISYAEAEAFYGVGSATGFHGITWDKAISEPGMFALNIAGHAAVGCITAEAQGGDCGPQALAAGISAAAAPAIYQEFGGASAGDVIGGTIASAAVGGVSSIAGGGKFENGAITAAYGYLFNAMAGRIVGGILGGAGAGIAGIETGPADAVAIGYGIAEGGEVGSALEDALVEAFHYTFGARLPSIMETGLSPGSYATTTGQLSGLQAQIDLALPPNRGLTDTVVRVDIAGLRGAGYQIPPITPVGREFNMPGGGYEMKFPYTIPPRYLSVVPK
jgi:RHS repeat-associated protein